MSLYVILITTFYVIHFDNNYNIIIIILTIIFCTIQY